jgi:hypothetical protein
VAGVSGQVIFWSKSSTGRQLRDVVRSYPGVTPEFPHRPEFPVPRSGDSAPDQWFESKTFPGRRVRYRVRSCPGVGPEIPACPEFPASQSGVSGLQRRRASRRLLRYLVRSGAGVSGPGRSFRSPGPETPDLVDRKTASFLEGYKYPSTYLQLLSSPRSEVHHCCKLKKH